MDPQQQQQLAGMMAGFGAIVGLIWLLMLAFMVFLFWRIFARAGMSGALALIAIFPGIGLLVCLCILAFGQWRVAPLPPGYSGDLPAYPPGSYPPQQYPAASYPPTEPPARL